MASKCSAKVQITLMVPAGSVWDGDAPLAQVHKQAKDDALRALQRGLKAGELVIIGEPKVTAVLVEEGP